ncbi:MOSC domain-containing protein [Desulfosoma caldarium]|uniref:MOSC domain-containing protein n=1 Tax=Desulfosoma caldarium TaxID=610254 RepID=A0A3N1VGF7_9BACT|nr:MOSC domain-containing protein [Desulfosoma caldarium]ROR01955.1 MOSC domain-containing protein [Desulfosoma caldarium]
MTTKRSADSLPRVVSLAVSRKKGTRKICVPEVVLVAEKGIAGDAHAGPGDRQVSFLASESIQRLCAQGLQVDFGDFAENIATEGVDWLSVPIGTRFALGKEAVVEVRRIGKECHGKCAIFYQAGNCIMPREGVFARVIQGGRVRVGDVIRRVDA